MVQLASSMPWTLRRVLGEQNASDMGISSPTEPWPWQLQDIETTSGGWPGRIEVGASMLELENLVWHNSAQAGRRTSLDLLHRHCQKCQEPNSRFGAVFGVFCGRLDGGPWISRIGWCFVPRIVVSEGPTLCCAVGSVFGRGDGCRGTSKLHWNILELCHWIDGPPEQDNVQIFSWSWRVCQVVGLWWCGCWWGKASYVVWLEVSLGYGVFCWLWTQGPGWGHGRCHQQAGAAGDATTGDWLRCCCERDSFVVAGPSSRLEARWRPAPTASYWGQGQCSAVSATAWAARPRPDQQCTWVQRHRSSGEVDKRHLPEGLENDGFRLQLQEEFWFWHSEAPWILRSTHGAQEVENAQWRDFVFFKWSMGVGQVLCLP